MQGGNCHADPPKPFLVMNDNPLLQPNVLAVWPPVGTSDWCMKHPDARIGAKPRPTVVPESLMERGPVEPIRAHPGANGNGGAGLIKPEPEFSQAGQGEPLPLRTDGEE